ncbi:porin family protein [Jejudonia soesokkakensis]|uniref:Porin family protein n=1 Tax=Jejudonia soesokkakensis TaxID=1323432 RepID=A0ABW2MVY2_9FLAO
MIKATAILFYLLLLSPIINCIGQEPSGPFSKEIDSLYREDQFYFGINYNILSDKPVGVEIQGLSGGLQLGYLRDMPINKRRNIAIAIGAGVSFDTYGQNLFIGEEDSEETIFTVLNSSEVNYDRNRISVYSIDAPIEFRWRSSTASTYKFWRVYAGMKIGYVYHYKTTFKQPGNEVFQTDIPEFEPLRLGATLSFGYNTFNLFAHYSINPFFKNALTTDGQDVSLKTIKLGLMFYIL